MIEAPDQSRPLERFFRDHGTLRSLAILISALLSVGAVIAATAMSLYAFHWHFGVVQPLKSDGHETRATITDIQRVGLQRNRRQWQLRVIATGRASDGQIHFVESPMVQVMSRDCQSCNQPIWLWTVVGLKNRDVPTYQVGDQISILHHPDQPGSEAILLADVSNETRMLPIRLGLVLILLAVSPIFFGLLRWLNRREEEAEAAA